MFDFVLAVSVGFGLPITAWLLAVYATKWSRAMRISWSIIVPTLVASIGLMIITRATWNPDEKLVGNDAFILTGVFQFMVAIAVVGASEAWFGDRFKE